MRLMVQIGAGCSPLMDTHLRDLTSEHIQIDEIWSNVQKKQNHIKRSDDRSRVGDMWAFGADVDYGQAVKFTMQNQLAPVGTRRRAS